MRRVAAPFEPAGSAPTRKTQELEQRTSLPAECAPPLLGHPAPAQDCSTAREGQTPCLAAVGRRCSAPRRGRGIGKARPSPRPPSPAAGLTACWRSSGTTPPLPPQPSPTDAMSATVRPAPRKSARQRLGAVSRRGASSGAGSEVVATELDARRSQRPGKPPSPCPAPRRLARHGPKLRCSAHRAAATDQARLPWAACRSGPELRACNLFARAQCNGRAGASEPPHLLLAIRRCERRLFSSSWEPHEHRKRAVHVAQVRLRPWLGLAPAAAGQNVPAGRLDLDFARLQAPGRDAELDGHAMHG